ncbi:hypothetical protein BD324DRAFT_521824 [Kockovaella imperatae]|uniref:Uncharacterized protein n=1 Tax=Kockovaella imperatae TaxID=4999 RepID=A0A1Y1UDJ3_9TREE|nr:hypothetical protein BD324DRAFT_521824 [Kockovaella imperatae]ORX36072.1 hypothetical protein BD324DRAFT_521824 [Kockovaella imperatae]
MSLRDAACYSLTLVPSLADPKVLELVENYNGPTDGPRAQTPRFARVKEQPRDKEVYSAAIYDYLSGAKLASMGMESTKSKSKSLQLHGPDEDISFEFTGKINFQEWTFTFEGNKFRWTRSFSRGSEYICSLDRKPDPRVEICLAKEADKKEPARLQILHYNIDRFPDEIKDLRGLETLLTATFMSFLDDMDSRNQRNSLSPAPDASIVPGASVFGQKTGSSASGQTLNAPQRVISEDDFEPENPNEILVSLNSSIDEHVSRAVWLLEDPHVLFIVIRTRASEATQRALEVSLGVTRRSLRNRQAPRRFHPSDAVLPNQFL